MSPGLGVSNTLDSPSSGVITSVEPNCLHPSGMLGSVSAAIFSVEQHGLQPGSNGVSNQCLDSAANVLPDSPPVSAIVALARITNTTSLSPPRGDGSSARMAYLGLVRCHTALPVRSTPVLATDKALVLLVVRIILLWILFLGRAVPIPSATPRLI